MEQELSKYCKQVKALLDCPSKDAKQCLKSIRRYADEIRQENPSLPPERIVEMLGEPQELAETFLETLSPVKMLYYRRRKRLFWRVFFIVTTVLVILALSFARYYFTTPVNVTPEELEAISSQGEASD